jgi:hypothetical protein
MDLLASSDTLAANIELVISGVVAICGFMAWMTKMAARAARIETRVEYIFEHVEKLGNASEQRNSSVIEKVRKLEADVNGLQLTFARWDASHPNPAH